MKNFFLLAFLVLGFNSFGQITKFSVEASYPLPIDKNFVGDNFTGIIDVGLKYRIKNLRVINFGFSLNAAYFTDSRSEYFPGPDEVLDFKTSLYMIEPKIFAEINLKGLTKLRPSAGIGYTFLMSDTKFDSPDFSNETTNQGGINGNIGLSYDIAKKLYILAHYDYTILSQLESGIPKTDYNTKISVVKIGLGLRL